MKLLNKVTPYSIKRAVPVLGMAMATLFGGCKKTEPEIVPTPKFERTFVFTPDTHAIDLAPTIAKTADSVQVSKVILQCQYGYFGGAPVSAILNNGVLVLIKDCSEQGLRKIVHRGIIDNAGMYKDDTETYKQYQADSAKLAQMGYTITNPRYTR